MSMDHTDMPFFLTDEEATALRRLDEMEGMPLLTMTRPARAPPPRDIRILVDDPEEAQAAGSSQGPGFSGAAAAGDGSGAADPETSDVPEDWKTRGLLHTVKSGDTDEIQRLRARVDPRLHAAARAQDVAKLRALLAAGAAPDALDWEGRTPLHLCVVLRLMKPFMVLLNAAGGPDARDASGLPLLHAAILHGWGDGVDAALAAGARVDATGPGPVDLLDLAPEHYDMSSDNNMHRYPEINPLLFRDSLPRTAIEIAITTNMQEMLPRILSVATANGVIDCFNSLGHTALHTAVWLEKIQAVETLLLSGASPHRVSDKGDTALHVAIHNPHILKYLLDNTDVKNSLNDEGFAPEHLAVRTKRADSLKLLLDKFNSTLVKTREEKHTPLHLAAMRGGDEVAKIILERETGETILKAMFEVDAQGETPLHLAAKNNNREMTALLLLNGAALSTKTKDENETTVLELISTNFYKAEDFFEQLFDGFIYNNNLLDQNAVHSDYHVLTDGGEMSQIKVLEEFVRCGQSKALIHPLIESLLYLKWKHFQPLFFILLGIYGIFLVSFNILMICIFYFEDISNKAVGMNSTLHPVPASGGGNNTVALNSTLHAVPASDGETTGSGGFHGAVYWLMIALTYFCILILLIQETMFVYLKRLSYYKSSAEPWVKLSGLALCALAPVAALAQGVWPRHVACAALLLAWLQAMFLVSRVSRWGYYVLMFGKVAVNILKILVTAIFLVIAFAFCFMIQYRAAAPFDGPFSAFVKTLVMMSSEFEYENLFKEHEEQLEDTETLVRILFVLFVIFVAIVLMNFMIGVAVSDINDLNETGNIRRLEKQVELLSTFEPLAYDGVLAKWFLALFGDKKYHSSMYTFRGNQSTWKVSVRNPPYTERFGDVTYDIKIQSSKLYTAIVETPSKQEQADEEARRHNTEKPYRSQANALNHKMAEREAGVARRGGGDDLIDRRVDNFDSLILKQQLSSLVRDSSRTSRDVELLKHRNEVLNVKMNHLSAMSSDILRSVKTGSNWTSLARRTRRPRRRAGRRSGRPADGDLPSLTSEEERSLAILRQLDFMSLRL